MNRTFNQNLILAIFLGLAVLLLNSCKAYTRAVGAGGNPEPNMKTVHMSTSHRGYTQEDVHQHPDYDCDQDSSTYVLIADR